MEKGSVNDVFFYQSTSLSNLMASPFRSKMLMDQIRTQTHWKKMYTYLSLS